MSKLKVYLSGSTKNVSEDFQEWREDCKRYSNDGFYDDLQFIDPISYFNYTNKQPMTDKQCLDLFMYQVEHCDVILVNLDHSEFSLGTAIEVEHAFCHNIPIIAFGCKKGTWYNWLEIRASVVFRSLSNALNYINDYYAI